jgi:hypothetical protein
LKPPVETVSTFGLRDILVIEDDEALLDFKCQETGHLLWPLIRIQFIRFILSDLLYGSSLIEMRKRHPYGMALRTLAKATLHNTARRSSTQVPIILMGTGLGIYLKEGRWFNRLADHFALARPDQSCVVEDFFEWRWPFPRHNERVLFHAPTQVAATIAGRLCVRQKHRDSAAKLIKLMRTRARQHLNWELGEERASYLTTTLARHVAALPIRRRAYQGLLSRSGVRLLIKEEACYGPSSVLIGVAKEMGVTTAEYQHGSISAGNDAYNLAPALANSPEYQKTLPEYFLGYGKWWNEQIDVPVKKLVIGNPHRSEQLGGLAASSPGEKCDVLILGDGIETRFYLDFARDLANRIGPGFQVVFRPHPLERQLVQDSFPDGVDGSVRMDNNRDIYQSFLTAHAVISEVSTGIFEAIGLVPRVFIWDTPKSRFVFPDLPFDTVKSADELAAKLISGEGHSSPVSEDEIWAPNWRANYLSFLEACKVVPPVHPHE